MPVYYGIHLPLKRVVPILYGCAAIGVVCAVIMAVGYFVNAGYTATEAVVLDNQSRTLMQRRGGTLTRKSVVCPRVRFRSRPDSSHEFVPTGACAATARYMAGDRITVYYMPDDPTDANVNAPDRPFNLMMAGLAVAFFCLGFALLFRRMDRRRAARAAV